MFDDKSDELFKICPFVKMCDENSSMCTHVNHH